MKTEASFARDVLAKVQLRKMQMIVDAANNGGSVKSLIEEAWEAGFEPRELAKRVEDFYMHNVQ